MDAATALGHPIAWTYAGKTYQIAERTLDWACAMQRKLEQNEYLGIMRHAELLGGMVPTALANWQKSLATGAYEWGTQAAWDYYTSPAGYRYALALSIAEGSGITVDEALAVVELAEGDGSPEGVLAWAAAKAIQKALNDPNRKRSPRQAQAGATA